MGVAGIGAALEARSVSLSRHGQEPLRDVDVVVPAGSLVGITGNRSAGPSTLLAVLGQVTPPDTGRVLVGGTDVYAASALEAPTAPRLGFVPIGVRFPRGLSVRDALMLVPMNAGRDMARAGFSMRDWRPPRRWDRRRTTLQLASRERVDEVLAEVGLTAVAGSVARDLPTHKQTLVVFAGALLPDPHWVFADEPAQPAFMYEPDMSPEEAARRIVAQLRNRARGSRGVVFTSHSEQVLAVCDLLLVLASDGQLAYAGPPEGAKAHFGVRDFFEIYNAVDRGP